MAMRDWNGNGKKDVADDWIEYNIYQESTKGNNPSSGSNYSSGSSSDSGGCFWIVLIIFFVVALLAECGA